MAEQHAAAGFPEIKVPAALTFAGLVLGFAAGILLQGQPSFAGFLSYAELAGKVWLRLLQITILPLVVGWSIPASRRPWPRRVGASSRGAQ